MTLSTIRARILLGRPGGVYGRVDDDTLIDTVARIVKAYAAAPSPWAFHLIMLRHDGKWAEQLIQIELDRMDVGADAATYCAATVIDVAVRMRECNAVYVEPPPVMPDATPAPVKPTSSKSPPAAKKPAVDKSGQLGLGI